MEYGYAQYHDANLAAAEECARMGLPPLTGTVKQVGWGNGLRGKHYPRLLHAAESIKNDANRKSLVMELLAYWQDITDAGWWIAAKDNLELVIEVASRIKSRPRHKCGHAPTMLQLCEWGQGRITFSLYDACLVSEQDAEVQAISQPENALEVPDALPVLKGTAHDIQSANAIRDTMVQGLQGMIDSTDGMQRQYNVWLLDYWRSIMDASWWIAIR